MSTPKFGTWGSSKFDGTGLKSIHGAAWEGRLKMLLKNTCEGVYLIVKLPAISLQACKFTKMNFFTHILQGFLLDFKLLFIVLFLEIISWKGASFFSGEWGCFSDGGGGFIFKWEVHPMGGTSVLMGEVFKKNCRIGGQPPHTHSHYGKPCNYFGLKFLGPHKKNWGGWGGLLPCRCSQSIKSLMYVYYTDPHLLCMST